ncbi:MAG: hypothetical protein M3O36_15075 [Myxococcota bacterium]|nr:hypothetical protein [Myxococcota bacterium]
MDDGGVFAGHFEVAGSTWLIDSRNRRLPTLQAGQDYFLSRRPLDVHCHGVGPYDFTDIANLRLQHIEQVLRDEALDCVLTLYLPRYAFDDFLALLDEFAAGRRAGLYSHIRGFAIEGPILASRGGTPERGVWVPTTTQWERLAAGGRKGLLYCVISPDATWETDGAGSDRPPDVAWIVRTLLDGGVLPAPGHFRKDDPATSARRLQELFDIVGERGRVTITDHLFNDMPLRFKHAWRTPHERKRRGEDLRALNISGWSFANLESDVGPVPAVMMRAARDGVVKVCLNFDGEHVDHAISSRAVELLGPGAVIGMTDRIDSRRLAGRNLATREASTLLYEHHGVVAAGSQSIDTQRTAMVRLGMRDDEIWRMFVFNGAEVFGLHPSTGAGASFQGAFIGDRVRMGAR